MVSRAISVALGALVLLAVRPARAADAPVSRARMGEGTRDYYGTEIQSGFGFVGFGAATAGSGVILLTRDGDFEHGLGWSSLILGGLTALAGAGYVFTVIPRREYFTTLLEKDPEKFKREEAEHIGGTNRRFVLYLGGEIAETLAGVGIASYGFIKDRDLYKGIGVGVATQGLGLLALDLPGAARAARHEDEVRRFNPSLAFSIGGGGRPWGAAVAHAF